MRFSARALARRIGDGQDGGCDRFDRQREWRELGSLASRRQTAQGLAQRARIVLLAAQGVENKNICERVGAAPNTVGKWRRRFAERRMEGLLDEPVRARRARSAMTRSRRSSV